MTVGKRMISLGVAAPILAGCDPIGGMDFVDTRDNSLIYAEWDTSSPHRLSACSYSSERQEIAPPPRDVLWRATTEGGPMSENIYRRATFYVCPELREVSE